MKQGSKYYPLFILLRKSEPDEVTLTLDEIEAAMEANLPATAYAQRAWWSNRNRGAVQANAWIDAGYRVINIDLKKGQITFRKPGMIYEVKRDGDSIIWDATLIKALRYHMGLSQAAFAEELGVRQPTISEWETSVYLPKRSTSKYLTMIAEQAGFEYGSSDV